MAVAAPRTPWRLILPIGLAYGLIMSAQVHLSSTMGGRPIGWAKSFALQMPVAAAWTLFSPVILILGRRFPIIGKRWVRHVGLHLVVSLSFIFFIDILLSWLTPLVLGTTDRYLLSRAARLFVIWIVSDGLLYWTILTVGLAVAHYRRLRERELTAAQLEAQLAQADLQALKSQLQPRFLFNSLHTIGSLVRTGDRDSAIKVTADLDARVPHLVLQPLVENAIRHGIAPHAFAGHVEVRARRADDTLELVVRDDGPGAGNGEGSRPGIGLSNTRARLSRLYGNDFRLAVINLPQGGLESRVEIPFHLALAEWERSA